MMAAELPSFLPASELGPLPSREEDALEELVRSQAAIIERLEDALDARQSSTPANLEPSLNPGDKQKLILLLDDLTTKVRDLGTEVDRLTTKIADMENVNNRSEQQIVDVRDLAKDRIEELHKEIVDIRETQIVDRKCVKELEVDLREAQDLIDQHAEAINKVWQASKKVRVATGKKSTARIEQLKEILKAGPKSYKELERLLDISPKEMNRLVSMMDSRSYEIFFRRGDNRQKVLRLRAWNSLTSNVKCSAGGDS